MSSESTSRRDWRALGAVLLVLLIGLCLRISVLDESAYYDELLAMNAVDAPDFTTYWEAQNAYYPPTMVAPLYFCMQYFWAQLIDTSVLATRELSLFFAMGALLMVYVLGRHLFDHHTGLLAMLFCVLSLSNINFSIEARMYAFMYLLSILSVYTFVRGCENSRSLYWIAHVVVNVLLIATHTFGALILFAQMAYLVLFLRQERTLLIAWLSVHIVLFLFTCAWVYQAYSSGFDRFVEDQYAVPTVFEVANAIVVYAGGRFTNWSPSLRMPMGLNFDLLIAALSYDVVLLFGIQLFRGRKIPDAQSDLKPYVLLIFWLLAPITVLVIMSILLKPYFVYRYALPSSMPLAILVAAFVMRLSSPKLRAICACGIIVLMTWQLTALREPIRPDYAGVAAHIEGISGESATIYTYKAYNREGLAFNSALEIEKIRVIQSPIELNAEFFESSSREKDVWILFWRWELLADFQHRLEEQEGTSFEVIGFGGLSRMLLYHLHFEGDSANRGSAA
ncbi:MAG: glycosyltransferase family 39 protein [Candidatus Hydrogenedentota bacterium]